jgi:hypothetical protein
LRGGATLLAARSRWGCRGSGRDWLGVSPWRRITWPSAARSGGPPAAAVRTSAMSRSRPVRIRRGVAIARNFASTLPRFSNPCSWPRLMQTDSLGPSSRGWPSIVGVETPSRPKIVSSNEGVVAVRDRHLSPESNEMTRLSTTPAWTDCDAPACRLPPAACAAGRPHSKAPLRTWERKSAQRTTFPND